LGTTTHSLYAMMKRFDAQQPQRTKRVVDQAEIAKLKAELRRVTQKRDIFQKGPL